MFYPAFAGVPEWAPPQENHILYSEAVLKNVYYAARRIQYTPTNGAGTEYLRLAFRPTTITVKAARLSLRPDLNSEGYTERSLGNGDFSVNIRRAHVGQVVVR